MIIPHEDKREGITTRKPVGHNPFWRPQVVSPVGNAANKRSFKTLNTMEKTETESSSSQEDLWDALALLEQYHCGKKSGPRNRTRPVPFLSRSLPDHADSRALVPVEGKHSIIQVATPTEGGQIPLPESETLIVPYHQSSVRTEGSQAIVPAINHRKQTLSVKKDDVVLPVNSIRQLIQKYSKETSQAPLAAPTAPISKAMPLQIVVIPLTNQVDSKQKSLEHGVLSSTREELVTSAEEGKNEYSSSSSSLANASDFSNRNREAPNQTELTVRKEEANVSPSSPPLEHSTQNTESTREPNTSSRQEAESRGSNTLSHKASVGGQPVLQTHYFRQPSLKDLQASQPLFNRADPEGQYCHSSPNHSSQKEPEASRNDRSYKEEADDRSPATRNEDTKEVVPPVDNQKEPAVSDEDTTLNFSLSRDHTDDGMELLPFETLQISAEKECMDVSQTASHNSESSSCSGESFSSDDKDFELPDDLKELGNAEHKKIGEGSNMPLRKFLKPNSAARAPIQRPNSFNSLDERSTHSIQRVRTVPHSSGDGLFDSKRSRSPVIQGGSNHSLGSRDHHPQILHNSNSHSLGARMLHTPISQRDSNHSLDSRGPRHPIMQGGGDHSLGSRDPRPPISQASGSHRSVESWDSIGSFGSSHAMRRPPQQRLPGLERGSSSRSLGFRPSYGSQSGRTPQSGRSSNSLESHSSHGSYPYPSRVPNTVRSSNRSLGSGSIHSQTSGRSSYSEIPHRSDSSRAGHSTAPTVLHSNQMEGFSTAPTVVHANQAPHSIGIHPMERSPSSRLMKEEETPPNPSKSRFCSWWGILCVLFSLGVAVMGVGAGMWYFSFRKRIGGDVTTKTCNGQKHLCEMRLNQQIFALSSVVSKQRRLSVERRRLETTTLFESGYRGVWLQLSDACFGAQNQLRVVVDEGCEDPIIVLEDLVRYLQGNPSEILILVFGILEVKGSREDHLSELLHVVPGLARHLYRHPGDAYPWPVLQTLVDQDTRMVAFVDSPKAIVVEFFHDWSSYGRDGTLDLTDSIAASTAYCGYIPSDLDFLSLEIVASCKTPKVFLDLQLKSCRDKVAPNFLVTDDNKCASDMVLATTQEHNAALVPVQISTANALLGLRGAAGDVIDTKAFVEQCQLFFSAYNLNNVECIVLSQSKREANEIEVLLQLSADYASYNTLTSTRLQQIINAAGSSWEQGFKHALGLTGIRLVSPNDESSPTSTATPPPASSPLIANNPPTGYPTTIVPFGSQNTTSTTSPTQSPTTQAPISFGQANPPVTDSIALPPIRNVTAVRQAIVDTFEEPRFKSAGNAPNLALDWILDDDEMTLHRDAINLVQRFTMAYFYFATSKSGWTSCGPEQGELNCIHHGQDQTQPAIRWLSKASECDWVGVKCDDQNQVVEISLDGMNLSGWVPYGLQFLTHLEKLSLVNSNLFGDLPGFALAKPEKLHTIDLRNNSIGGKIPDGLTTSKSLQHLDLSSNAFSDTLPESIGKMNLTTLVLTDNNMTGPIPDSIYTSKTLEVLDLQSNQFTGSIRSTIGQMFSLRELNLANNLFNGDLPSELSKLTGLEKFWISGTDLKGTVPAEMCKIGLQLMEADCLATVNGLTEVSCSCCTVCCDLNGDRCKATNVQFGVGP